MYNSDVPNPAELPSATQLLKSTLVALLVAVLLLITAILPAEYGLDPTGVGRLLGLTKMGEIKMQAAAGGQPDSTAAARPVPAPAPASAPASTSASATALPAAPAAPLVAAGQANRSDQTTVTLKPGEGAEIKLEMVKGATVQYRWVAQGGAVNFDAHGEASNAGFAVSYKKGKATEQDQGMLEAAFDGQHGWYWRNRGKGVVTIGLTTEGQYQSIKRVL